jgi:hypothetical protein
MMADRDSRMDSWIKKDLQREAGALSLPPPPGANAKGAAAAPERAVQGGDVVVVENINGEDGKEEEGELQPSTVIKHALLGSARSVLENSRRCRDLVLNLVAVKQRNN